MNSLLDKIAGLHKKVKETYIKLGYDKVASQLEDAQKQMSEPDFWDNPKKANEFAKRAGELKNRLDPWQRILAECTEIEELARLDDGKITGEIEQKIEEIKSDFEKLRTELKFSGLYDDHSAIVSIFAGAGGTDAQDWAQMLMRMYLRFFEKLSWKSVVIEESQGEEAGIKSATLEVDAAFAYGNLKGEHGVHRLVRQSPFNADSLRQTSFARVEVLPKVETPDELVIDDNDLKIDVFRAGGHGGQSVNTTDSAVRVTHLPSGISVAIQNERSQLQNKETAMTILRSKLAQLQMEQHKKTLDDIKGPNEQAAWGNQIRNYVLHPYKQVKDLRTGTTSKEPEKILAGDLQPFISAYLENTLKAKH